jgi:hypothetical protein
MDAGGLTGLINVTTNVPRPARKNGKEAILKEGCIMSTSRPSSGVNSSEILSYETNDFVLPFYAFSSGKQQECGVRIRLESLQRALVVISEKSTALESTGVSHAITDNFDRIATRVYRRYLFEMDPERVIWVKHCKDEADEEVFQRVELSWDGERFGIPQWRVFNAKAFHSAFASA